MSSEQKGLRVPKGLKAFVKKWEMAWHLITVAVFAAALATVLFVFPDVNNLWVSIFVLVGSATSAVTAAISSIKE